MRTDDTRTHTHATPQSFRIKHLPWPVAAADVATPLDPEKINVNTKPFSHLHLSPAPPTPSLSLYISNLIHSITMLRSERQHRRIEPDASDGTGEEMGEGVFLALHGRVKKHKSRIVML